MNVCQCVPNNYIKHRHTIMYVHLQGSQGDVGPKGDRGDTGAQGIQGPEGPQVSNRYLK